MQLRKGKSTSGIPPILVQQENMQQLEWTLSALYIVLHFTQKQQHHLWLQAPVKNTCTQSLHLPTWSFPHLHSDTYAARTSPSNVVWTSSSQRALTELVPSRLSWLAVRLVTLVRSWAITSVWSAHLSLQSTGQPCVDNVPTFHGQTS